MSKPIHVSKLLPSNCSELGYQFCTGVPVKGLSIYSNEKANTCKLAITFKLFCTGVPVIVLNIYCNEISKLLPSNCSLLRYKFYSGVHLIAQCCA